MSNAGYNSRGSMLRNRTRFCALAALALFVCLPAAAQWAGPAAGLAHDIAAITGPGTITLDTRNISSFPTDQLPVIQRELESALREAGVRVVSVNPTAADVALTLSENVRGYLWVAEVRQAGETRIAMVTAPRRADAAPPRNGPALAIRKTPLWSQEAPILDAALLPGPQPYLVVLDFSSASLYKMSDGRWALEQQMPIPRPGTWPRDLRGRVLAARDHLFDAYLPGIVCRSSAAPPLVLRCLPGDDPWPIGAGQTALFGAARNFFTGVVTPGIGRLTSIPAFYSAAGIPRPQYTLWALALTDGSFRLMDGVNDLSLRSARGWGSDIASVSSSCGTRTQLLVTGTGDSGAADVVRAFEIADREPDEVSPPVEFAGPLTALWSSADGRSATAVAHNLKTGQYDAFEIAISCGQ